jgi:hypothetical protein
MPLFDKITEFSDMATADTKVQKEKKKQKEQQAAESARDPVDRMVTFINSLPEKIRPMLSTPISPEKQQQIIREINDTFTRILQDASKGSEMITVEDSTKISRAIQEFQKSFPWAYSSTGSSPTNNLHIRPDTISFIHAVVAELNDDEWKRMLEECNVPNPRDRINNFIVQLKNEIDRFGRFEEAEQRYFVHKINKRMENIRIYNQEAKYNLQEAKSLSEDIKKLQEICKRIPGGEKIALALEIQYQAILVPVFGETIAFINDIKHQLESDLKTKDDFEKMMQSIENAMQKIIEHNQTEQYCFQPKDCENIDNIITELRAQFKGKPAHLRIIDHLETQYGIVLSDSARYEKPLNIVLPPTSPRSAKP